MFVKYTSIENTYRDEFLERIEGHGFGEDTFIVQEKVHGANLSYWTTDGKEFFAAKRTAPIVAGEKFYNHDSILREIQPKLSQVWLKLAGKKANLRQLTVFGEILGGEYPHEEVKPVKGAILVHKGIFYSPNNLFYAFDILINSETYLDVEIVNELFEKYELLHAKTLFEGSLKECLAYPNDFETTLPQELGLPVLTPNIAEGTVIKPVNTRHFNNGVRVILKNKNEKWAENKRYHKTIKKGDISSEKVLKLEEAILTYVTENRLDNVFSKIGQVTEKDFGKVLGMFNKDAIEDFLKDYHQITDDLDKKELKQIKKSFTSAARELINAKIKAS
ncbi:MAG: RNA ligase, Rnl2 family [Bacteroidota bacterium]